MVNLFLILHIIKTGKIKMFSARHRQKRCGCWGSDVRWENWETMGGKNIHKKIDILLSYLQCAMRNALKQICT